MPHFALPPARHVPSGATGGQAPWLLSSTWQMVVLSVPELHTSACPQPIVACEQLVYIWAKIQTQRVSLITCTLGSHAHLFGTLRFCTMSCECGTTGVPGTWHLL